MREKRAGGVGGERIDGGRLEFSCYFATSNTTSEDLAQTNGICFVACWIYQKQNGISWKTVFTFRKIFLGVKRQINMFGSSIRQHHTLCSKVFCYKSKPLIPIQNRAGEKTVYHITKHLEFDFNFPDFNNGKPGLL